MEVRPGYKQTDVGVIPDDWDAADLRHLCIKIQDGTHFSPQIRGDEFLYVTSRNVGFGFLDVSSASRIDATQHREIYRRCDVRKGDLLLTKDGANTGNAALNTLDEEFSLLSSVAVLRFDDQHHCPAYFLQQVLSQDGQRRIKDAMAGNAITRLTLAKISSLEFPYCKVAEERAIAAALSDVDALLAGLGRLIAKKRDLKQAAMQQLLTGKTRLPGFHGEWKPKKFSDLLRYERPDKYIVKSADYEQGGDTPVLTANKSFILGYTNEKLGVCHGLPVIIFDDFTTDSKYVDFPFKVKSSAIKILRSRSSEVNLRFVAERMRLVSFPVSEHKRYYISEYQHIELPTPDPEEQCAIEAVLSDMDVELAALEARRDKSRDLKQAMMQELLTGKTRLPRSETVNV